MKNKISETNIEALGSFQYWSSQYKIAKTNIGITNRKRGTNQEFLMFTKVNAHNIILLLFADLKVKNFKQNTVVQEATSKETSLPKSIWVMPTTLRLLFIMLSIETILYHTRHLNNIETTICTIVHIVKFLIMLLAIT